MKKLSNISPFLLLIAPILVVMLSLGITNNHKNNEKALANRTENSEPIRTKINIEFLK